MTAPRLSPEAHALCFDAIKRSFERAAVTFDKAAVLHERTREQLLERLDLVAIEPQRVVDAGCATGAALGALAARFPAAEIIGIDIAWPMLQQAHGSGRYLVAADAHRLPFGRSSVDCVFSNLMLPWCDLDAAFAETRRVLRPGGLYTFSTLGPDTLNELRAAWAAADDYCHVSFFPDMHDIGDGLVRAGFADPVMDVDRFTLTYDSLTDLMRDLRATGARNATSGRARTLTGKGRLRACTAHYERFRDEGRLPATFEVVYGHAWAGDSAQRIASDGSVGFPVDEIDRRR